MTAAHTLQAGDLGVVVDGDDNLSFLLPAGEENQPMSQKHAAIVMAVVKCLSHPETWPALSSQFIEGAKRSSEGTA